MSLAPPFASEIATESMPGRERGKSGRTLASSWAARTQAVSKVDALHHQVLRVPPAKTREVDFVAFLSRREYGVDRIMPAVPGEIRCSCTIYRGTVVSDRYTSHVDLISGREPLS